MTHPLEKNAEVSLADNSRGIVFDLDRHETGEWCYLVARYDPARPGHGLQSWVCEDDVVDAW